MSRSKPSLSCGKAQHSVSTSVYDLRKKIFDPRYINSIDNTLDYNLVNWEVSCPLGYEQEGKRCKYVEMPYPTWYKGQDIMKQLVMRELQKEKEMEREKLLKRRGY